MNEIFSNEVSQLTLSTAVRGQMTLPTALPTANLYVSNSIDFDVTPTALTVTPVLDESTAETGEYTVAVPYSAVQEKRFAKVVYSYTLTGYGTISKEEFFEIRTRLLSYDEYVLMSGNEDVTFDAFNLAETESRMIIEGFTRQVFSKWTGNLTFNANPNRIYVPQYLRELTSVTEYDEFDLSSANTDYKREDNGYVVYKDVNIERDRGFKRFTVTGKWGYLSVPDNVKKAAYELTRDFLSSVINKRRQFLLNAGGQGLGATFTDSVDLISWRAYMDSTGNAVADQLLINNRILQPGII